MRTKLSVLSQKLSLAGATTLNLPRNSIHDAYILHFSVKLTNGTGSPITPTIKDVLDAIQEIRLVTDSVRVHYALTGYDLALLNSKIQKIQTHNVLNKDIDESWAAVAAAGTKDVEFCLYLDEGDIIAVAHTNVEMTVQFAATTALGFTVTTAECEVTIKESICTSAELLAKYGEDLTGVVEPKVYALETSQAANTEFSGILDIPTGTLLRGAIVSFSTAPSQVGILRTVPDRVELAKENWTARRALDEILYQTTFPAGVIIYDFRTQWQDNGVGKDGWSFAKGDVQLACKSPSSATVRYISIEALVNQNLFKETYSFTEY